MDAQPHGALMAILALTNHRLNLVFWSNFNSEWLPTHQDAPKALQKYLEQCRRGLFAEVFAGDV